MIYYLPTHPPTHPPTRSVSSSNGTATLTVLTSSRYAGYHPCIQAELLPYALRVLIDTLSRRAMKPELLACTCGCSLCHARLQPPSRTVAASITYGCSLCHARLQPLPRTVAASATHGCSLHHVRLQAELLAMGIWINDKQRIWSASNTGQSVSKLVSE